jgi:hypothetical protein
MSPLDDLQKHGFVLVTEWVRKGEKLALKSLGWPDHGGWVYAFVVEGEVRYIGMTNRVLRSRMDDYRHIDNEQTSRLRRHIAAELDAGRSVEIYGQKNSSPIADEAKLIAACQPEWNR